MFKSLLWGILIIIFIISAFVGSVELNFFDLYNLHSISSTIFYNLRLPRLVLAFSAGGILSLSGLLYQSIFRNALMTPYTLGVSSGGVLGAGIAIKLGLGITFFGIGITTVFGFMGALLTVFLLIYFARFMKNSTEESLLLLGIALSMFYSSVLMIVFYFSSSVETDMLIHFTMGSLSVIGWKYPVIVLVGGIFLFIYIYRYRYELQLLSISQEQAQFKGVDTQKVIIKLLVVSSIAIGILVSISGPIGFVGLVAPHIVQKLYLVSLNNRILKTTFFGGLFLVACDTVSRTLQTQSEIPIGIITAVIGVPFFIYLIISNRKK